MNGTWWVGPEDLDEDQSKIISIPIDNSILVTGPPGCGKTNLLLLRANYLFLYGFHNIAIISFTRSLKNFIANGAEKYEFPKSKILTCKEWQSDLLKQYGAYIKPTGDFEKDRNLYSSEIDYIIKNFGISNIYDAIFLDEAQDYTVKEVLIFSKLSKRLFFVADERQKIYNGDDSLAEIHKLVNSHHALKYHYRNGVKICQVADDIAKGWHGYRPLIETSNYNEKDNPSSAYCYSCKGISEQVNLILPRLKDQLIAYPNQLIGILCPKIESVQIVWDMISRSEFKEKSLMIHSTVNEDFQEGKNIIISTFHAAKGLEFRSLHLVNCDELKKFGNNRRMAFTAVTRAKTSLSVYHSGRIHDYFEAAIKSTSQNFTPPTMKDLFGGSR